MASGDINKLKPYMAKACIYERARREKYPAQHRLTTDNRKIPEGGFRVTQVEKEMWDEFLKQYPSGSL